jgi:Flp pilus assembly protein TadG
MVIVRRRKENRHRGVALVETAVVLPLLLLVTFGAIKYGWLFLKAQQITNAARHGARMAVLPDVTTDEVKTSVTGLLAAANIVVNAGEIVITPVDVSLDGHPAINVQITIPSERVDILMIPLFPQGGDIYASVTMAQEGT